MATERERRPMLADIRSGKIRQVGAGSTNLRAELSRIRSTSDTFDRFRPLALANFGHCSGDLARLDNVGNGNTEHVRRAHYVWPTSVERDRPSHRRYSGVAWRSNPRAICCPAACSGGQFGECVSVMCSHHPRRSVESCSTCCVQLDAWSP